jgi:hypothetical protein
LTLVPQEARARLSSKYDRGRGIADLLASADAVLAATGERVRACPRYGARRPEAA